MENHKDQCLSKPTLRVQRRLVLIPGRHTREVKLVARGYSPYNSAFMEDVLKPRSIKILADRVPDTASAHSDIEVPETRHLASVDPKTKLPESSIWIDTSETFVKRIKKRYTDMRFRNHCDAEYETYAKDILLKRDEFVNDEQTHVREWRAERFMELAAESGPRGTSVAPPVIEGSVSANFISAG